MLNTSSFDQLVAREAHPMAAQNWGPAMSGLIASRQLGDYRRAAGLTQQQVVKEVDFSAAKLFRIEDEDSPFATKYSNALVLLDLYGVIPDEQAKVLTNVRAAKQVSSVVLRDTISRQRQLYLECEAKADSVVLYEPNVLPGILQTDSYADMMKRVSNPDLSAEVAAQRR